MPYELQPETARCLLNRFEGMFFMAVLTSLLSPYPALLDSPGLLCIIAGGLNIPLSPYPALLNSPGLLCNIAGGLDIPCSTHQACCVLLHPGHPCHLSHDAV